MAPSRSDTYVVTGPTSGIEGAAQAIELSAYGTVILVGRDRQKLDGVLKQIERAGGRALAVVYNLPEPVERSARRR